MDEWLDTCVRTPAKKNGTYMNYKYVADRVRPVLGKATNQCDRGKILSPLVLCMICGLRRGEAAGLRWDFVDLDKKTLTVI